MFTGIVFQQNKIGLVVEVDNDFTVNVLIEAGYHKFLVEYLKKIDGKSIQKTRERSRKKD